MCIKLTNIEVEKTIIFFVDNAIRKYKKALENYNSPASKYYCNYVIAFEIITDSYDESFASLHGVSSLFIGTSIMQTELTREKQRLAEEKALYLSLLTVGKHCKHS